MSLIHRILQRIMGIGRPAWSAPAPESSCDLGWFLPPLSIWVVATRFVVINNTSDLLSPKTESKKITTT